MNKTTTQNINSSLPSLVTNVGNYLKSVVSIEKQKDTITNASGTIGFFISLLGKPLIDGYFERETTDKLADYGFKTYLKAAFHQAEISLSEILHLVTNDVDLKAVTIGLEKNVFDGINKLEKELTVLVFQPKYHPAVVFIKDLVINTFSSLGIVPELIDSFRTNFNSNIEATVGVEFGEDNYIKHKKSIETLWFEKNETELLLNCISQRKIGFTAKEELKYEDAYGSWESIHRGFSSDNDEEKKDIKEIEALEETLFKVDDLIEEYFTNPLNNPTTHLEKILFVIADFGKGKSVFLRNYAAQLAERYLATGEGCIPVYFNLRNFVNYAQDSQFGILEDYLQTEYAIKINSDYFINKGYCFLIDSLDESCDLSKSSVEKVISSIKRIQNLDKTKYRTNRVILTSRPFDGVLYNQISSHKPHPLFVEEKIKEHYISIYGFKKSQFNDWIYQSLSNIQEDIDLESTDGVIKNILAQIHQGNPIDVYNLLLDNETLSVSELRRPIFAYMIYKLLTNNINVTKTGKIGIYLSFLNLLSKEAKYIYDPNYQISLLEQYEARNILHLTSALWSYQKQNGKQGSLKKADLCRIMDQNQTNEADERILERYRNNNLNQIEFLSHSYFGEQSNVLHFQHQSFAEILLAEYYLKVIVKFALDRNYNIDVVTSKLMLGTPTKQTIQFLSEILKLVRDTISDNPGPEIIEKRKLILPLFASISINVNNPTLYSDRLFYEWFSKANITKHTTDVPEILTTNWCLTTIL